MRKHNACNVYDKNTHLVYLQKLNITALSCTKQVTWNKKSSADTKTTRHNFG